MEGPKPEKRKDAYAKWNGAQKDFEEAGGISGVPETVGNILDALPSGLEFRKEQELRDLLMDLICASSAEAEKCARVCGDMKYSVADACAAVEEWSEVMRAVLFAAREGITLDAARATLVAAWATLMPTRSKASFREDSESDSDGEAEAAAPPAKKAKTEEVQP
jgi:hypothetical protein